MGYLLKIYVIAIISSSAIASSEEFSNNIVNEKNSNIQIAKSEALQLRIYASLPEDDKGATVEHAIYSKDGLLVLECMSTNKIECIENIKIGKYSVRSKYRNKIHTTKLIVLKETDAYLYTSFKSKSQSADNSNNNNSYSHFPKEVSETEISEEQIIREEELMIKEETYMADPNKFKNMRNKILNKKRRREKRRKVIYGDMLESENKAPGKGLFI